MNFKTFINDEDAVSPVIGVILMVAITVILAAVIGTFVLGLGENLQQTSPTAQISFDQSAGNDAVVEIDHNGGDKLQDSQIDLQLDDSNGDDPGLDKTATDWADADGEIKAGASVTVSSSNTDDLEAGDIVKVVWTAEDGSTSSVIAEYEVN